MDIVVMEIFINVFFYICISMHRSGIAGSIGCAYI